MLTREIENINNTDFDEALNYGKIIVLNGIAGSCKSTVVNSIFHGDDVIRVLPSNVQAEDARERFCDDGSICGTAASILFHNADGRFYLSEKQPDCKNIIIDEFCQQAVQVANWVNHNKDRYNIVILTDDRQMLVPESGEIMLNKFHRIQDDAFNVVLKKTYRPLNKKTEEDYYTLYNNVATQKMSLKKYLQQFPVIEYKSMPYSPEYNYYTYTRAEEEMIYTDNEISKYASRSIKKGVISSKQKSDIKAPFMSQERAMLTKAKAYLQADNISTITRAQGRQNEQGRRGYFLLPRSGFTLYARAIYTLITRYRDLNDLTVVICDDSKKDFSTFMGLPIKKEGMMYLDEAPKTNDDWNKIAEKARKDTKDGDYYYPEDRVKSPNGMIIRGREDNKGFHKGDMTIRTVMKKDEKAYINYAMDVYKILEKRHIDSIKDVFKLDMSNDTGKEYSLDFRSCFPTIAANTKMPVSGHIYTEYRKDKLNFFGYSGGYYTNNSIITEELARYISKTGKGNVYFLFSTDYEEGTFYGKYIYEKATKDKQSKAKTKAIDWGTLQKPLIRPNSIEKPEFYIYNPDNVYQLHMVAIKSRLAYIMSRITDFIGEDCIYITDDIRWNSKDYREVASFVEENFPEMSFRIKQLDVIQFPEEQHFDDLDSLVNAMYDGGIKREDVKVYQNYEELKDRQVSKEALKKRRQRERKREMTKTE